MIFNISILNKIYYHSKTGNIVFKIVVSSEDEKMIYGDFYIPTDKEDDFRRFIYSSLNGKIDTNGKIVFDILSQYPYRCLEL